MSLLEKKSLLKSFDQSSQDEPRFSDFEPFSPSFLSLFYSFLLLYGYISHTDKSVKFSGPNVIVTSVFHCIKEVTAAGKRV